MSEKTFKYSETFYSAQGEGQFTGRASLWIRFYLCNLQCDGFGQDDPTDPDSYDLPYDKLDLKDITRVEDLPVFAKGCDSSYTWSKKYRHLMKNKTAAEICDELEALLPHGKFIHPTTGQDVHLVFTGGEPMMKHSQEAMKELLDEFDRRNNLPKNVTVETNGTQPINEDGVAAVRKVCSAWNNGGGKWFWSISPKLWSTAGEAAKRAIKPEVVRDYYLKSRNGQLKYVVNGSPASWIEVERHTRAFREHNVPWDVWIMASGARKEELILEVEDDLSHEAVIANEAIARGYSFTTRAHVHIYGNKIGT
jgi:6-pyruvoyltetrahydropterin 2'-reductase